jgi:polysaccharide biosynthesis/export protein
MVGTVRSLAVLFLAALLLLGCGGSGAYVWVADMPSEEVASRDYLIESGDVVVVRVFNQDAMSTRARVRSDGKLSVPFLGDVLVRGKSPSAVSRELEERFKSYVVSPTVTVTVDEFQPSSVAVIGEVAHPGVYPIDSAAAGVLRALAQAGGLTEYAHRDGIYVLRSSPARRIRFSYEGLTQNQNRAAVFRLRAGDTVVVE